MRNLILEDFNRLQLRKIFHLLLHILHQGPYNYLRQTQKSGTTRNTVGLIATAVSLLSAGMWAIQFSSSLEIDSSYWDDPLKSKKHKYSVLLPSYSLPSMSICCSWKCKRPGHLPEDCVINMGVPAPSPADPTQYHVRMILLLCVLNNFFDQIRVGDFLSPLYFL